MVTLSDEAFNQLLNRLSELEHANTSSYLQCKKIKDHVSVLPLDGDKEKDWYAWSDANDFFEKLSIGIHYKTISSRLNDRCFEKNGALYKRRVPRHLNDDEFYLSVKLFEELSSVFNKFYELIHEND